MSGPGPAFGSFSLSWWESVPGRLRQTGCITSLSKTPSLPPPVCVSCSVRLCARICSPTPASPPLVLPTPAAGYKAFSNHRQLLSDQDRLRQHHPAAVNHGPSDSSWWVASAVSSKYQVVASLQLPRKCQLQLKLKSESKCKREEPSIY